MRATNWEFANRALIFGLIFWVPFSLYVLDPVNVTAMCAHWLGVRSGMNEDRIARLLFACAAALLTVAALIRTWASSYLHANVVYAAQVKTESLVADGPYRFVRNPLYFANVLMAIGMGAMMSRSGYLVALVAMPVFCLRLILREESDLQASQGEMYARYRKAVPRLLPSGWPRIAASGSQAKWGAGFQAESWNWGFAAAIAAFAITLNFKLMLGILGASIALFWVSSTLLQKKKAPEAGSSRGP
jgi:protein-S-isoprenylcysteine O-methyltransferase Ste14